MNRSKPAFSYFATDSAKNALQLKAKVFNQERARKRKMLQSKSRDRVDTNLDHNNQIREMVSYKTTTNDKDTLDLNYAQGEASTKPMTPTQTNYQSTSPSNVGNKRRNIMIGQSTRSLNQAGINSRNTFGKVPQTQKSSLLLR